MTNGWPHIPGVYVEELPGGVRPIRPAPTGRTGFVGVLASGPMNRAVRILSLDEFTAAFGDSSTPTSRAVELFFTNGGRWAYVVRTASDADSDLVGDQAEGTGLFALDVVEQLNLLCIPDTANLSGDAAATVVGRAQLFCEHHRAFLIVDPPGEPDEAARWLAAHPMLHHPNAAAYVPRLRLGSGRAASATPSGAVAGVLSRTDEAHGVWKAPAGIDAVIRGDVEVAHPLDDESSRSLTTTGVNVIRPLQAHPVVWGARTMDQSSGAAEWRYIPVRRTFLFLEDSIERGTRWAVFEPNDEPLWTELRRIIGDFLSDLFRAGAFQGSKEEEAFFVRVGADTTGPADIERGLVNILVGFAPLRPAEFVVFTIAQRAGSPNAALRGAAPSSVADIVTAAERTSRGVRVLLSGPSGAAKTAVAEALTRELGVSLYRIDLGEVVGKYIGETEKNLRQLFDLAEAGGAILFFDEADALFGRRTEVRDSPDRSANLEVSSLLERIEDHPGVIILATTQPESLDGLPDDWVDFTVECRLPEIDPESPSSR